MSTNSILDELHATRERLLAAAGGDLHRYVQEARERAMASGRAIAEPTGRTRRPKVATGPEVIAPEVIADPLSQNDRCPAN